MPQVFHAPLFQVIPDRLLEITIDDQQVPDGKTRLSREVRTANSDEELIPTLTVSTQGEQHCAITKLKPGVRRLAITRQLPARPLVRVVFSSELPLIDGDQCP